jgi:hypothetical protein
MNLLVMPGKLMIVERSRKFHTYAEMDAATPRRSEVLACEDLSLIVSRRPDEPVYTGSARGLSFVAEVRCRVAPPRIGCAWRCTLLACPMQAHPFVRIIPAVVRFRSVFSNRFATAH